MYKRIELRNEELNIFAIVEMVGCELDVEIHRVMTPNEAREMAEIITEFSNQIDLIQNGEYYGKD